MNRIDRYTNEDNQFYPTPESFLKQIENDFYSELKGLRKECGADIKVLEPSAGKGDIADYIKKWGVWASSLPRCDVECIEIDKTLQATLKGKGYPVVYDDFLSFDTMTKYDLIFMNPPFEYGAEHLLKAIKMQRKYGGRILCILNAETLRNTCYAVRKTLQKQLEQLNAKIKYYQGSFCAYDSERITDVETAVVWIDILAAESTYTSKIFEDFDKAAQINIPDDSGTEQTELIKMGLDWITAYIKQYKEQIASSLLFFKEYQAFKAEYDTRYINILPEDERRYFKAFELKIFGNEYDNTDVNGYIEMIRGAYWRALFGNPKFSKRLTRKLENELHSRMKEFEKYEFTERNILLLMEENVRATIKGIEDEIMQLFKDFTSYAQYDGCDNIHYYNGWKTNRAHKLNSKIIIPFYGVWRREDKYTGNSLWNMRKSGYEYRLDYYAATERLTDMSKTLNFLADGVCALEKTESLTETIQYNFDHGNAKNIETQFFTLTFYKKGTCHIKFRNQDLLDKFNLFASQRKGWLPPSYGKKRYEEMDEEEKTLVKEFSESKENYDKIFNNQSKFLIEEQRLLQITEQ